MFDQKHLAEMMSVQGPAERRKPSNNGQPKTPTQSEVLKKRSMYTSQADTAQQPPAKKKLSVSGKFRVGGIVSLLLQGGHSLKFSGT